LVVPEGRIRFCVLTALTTSAGRRPARLQRLHVEVDRDHADLAAVGEGDRHAGNRHQLRAQAVHRVVEHRLLGSVGLESASWITGIDEAEYLMMSGGVMPGGSWRTCGCIAATPARSRSGCSRSAGSRS
jgi:hypothetical protein